jgi:uncharacterized protein (TIGR00299 family) protein
MDNTLYLECYSGISGDMTVAALLDLGADEKVLLDAVNSLPLEGFRVEVSRVKKSGIDACDFNVILDKKHENHDHDMEYLHGKGKGHSHDHDHDHSHDHSHDHDHDHEHNHDHDHEHNHDHDHAHDHSHNQNQFQAHKHSHEHRGMKEIREIIEKGNITARAKEIALRIFSVLAQAESKAHSIPIDEVHFHEVGAVDSIVDIVAVAVCFDNLQIKEVIVPKVYEGCGTIRCQHGILPVPVPAVANIIQAHNINLQLTEVEGEFVTPTGAAIIAATKTSDILPKEFKVLRIGLGAGKRNYERPGILRAMLIQSSSEESKDIIYKLESNIDDCSGENLGFVMEQLFLAGARDVHYIPTFMKKNRPAWLLNVICKKEDIQKLERIIFKETTTIGIRRVEMERSILKREQIRVTTPLGIAEVKVCEVEGEKRYYPEYESVVALCKQHNIPYTKAYQLVVQQCEA